ncbi:hypothetical protein OG21DRAFT_25855 [Imleria badia]|nr:hypothetical protein OG21DRAFT_25855 [Imleria badia]
MLALPCLVLALSALALPAQLERDVLGLLGGDSDTSSAFLFPDPTHHSLKPTASSSVSPSVTSTLALSRSSVEQSTPNTTSPTAEPTAVKTALVSTSSLLPASAESHDDHSSKTWQIIGIAIIVVLFIATSITCAMFFDRLWRFLKDVVCCTSSPLASEEFIADCEKQSCDTETLSPSPSDWNHGKTESLHEVASVQARNLPWNTRDWNTLHQHPSRRNDRPPPT